MVNIGLVKVTSGQQGFLFFSLSKGKLDWASHYSKDNWFKICCQYNRSITFVKESWYEEQKANKRGCVEKQEYEGEDGVGVGEHCSGSRLELDADEEDDDEDGDGAAQNHVDEPAHPVHPARQPHQLHQFLQNQR